MGVMSCAIDALFSKGYACVCVWVLSAIKKESLIEKTC